MGRRHDGRGRQGHEVSAACSCCLTLRDMLPAVSCHRTSSLCAVLSTACCVVQGACTQCAVCQCQCPREPSESATRAATAECRHARTHHSSSPFPGQHGPASTKHVGNLSYQRHSRHGPIGSQPRHAASGESWRGVQQRPDRGSCHSRHRVHADSRPGPSRPVHTP